MENRFEETSKEVDFKWQKKAGLDLRRDKTKILKEYLSKAQQDGRSVPKTDSAQLFKGRIGESRISKTNVSEVELRNHKGKALKRLRKLKSIQSGDERRKKLRRVEVLLYQILVMSGTFDDEEADLVMDAYVYCQERPGGHPLQNNFVVSGHCGEKGSKRTFVRMSNLFSHPPLRQALARRGFYLNIGLFSVAESLTLLKNFNDFLSSKGLPTDPESVWKLVKDDFRSFFKKYKLFLYIGDNLNRTTDQLYSRLKSLIHMNKRNKTNAEEDALIVEQAKKLKAKGIHRRFKHVGEELDRYYKQVRRRFEILTTEKFPLSFHLTKFFELVVDYEKRFPSKGLDFTRNEFDSFAAKLNCSKEDLEVYWIKEGKRNYEKSKLPRWTLKDTDLLLDKIQESGEDEENCVDFESICNGHFRGKVVDWKHLREHFTRIRRVVPYYMLDDLQSVVQVTKKHVAERLRKQEELGLGEEEDVEDEDLMES